MSGTQARKWRHRAINHSPVAEGKESSWAVSLLLPASPVLARVD